MTDPARNIAAAEALLAWWGDAGIAPLPDTARPAVRRDRAPIQPRAADRTAPMGAPSPDARPTQGMAHPAAQRPAAPARPAGPDPQQLARTAAAAADSLTALRAAVEAFDGCALKQTAKTTVFHRGALTSGVMVVGEAPGFEEDARGEPFVGRSGVLLDRMFGTIGLDRDAVYITNILFWRPPGNRNPSEDDIRACLPFVERHIALAQPKLLVLAGKLSAQTLLGATEGITRLRGRWGDYRVKDTSGAETGVTIPALPLLHPAFLLRQPAWKAQTWRDLLSLQAKLTATD